MSNIVRGYETRVVARLSAELQARALSSMEIAATRVEALLKASAAPHSDTGKTEAGITVDVVGGIGPAGGRELGMIAAVKSEAAEWLDKGTRPGITRPSGKSMPVGKRSPNRANAPVKGVTMAKVVSGQPATHFFSAPNGVPLAETMRNIYAGIFRRVR